MGDGTVHHEIVLVQPGTVQLETAQLGTVPLEREVSLDQPDPDLGPKINLDTRRNPDQDPSIRRDPDLEKERGPVIAEGRGQETKDQGHIPELRSQRKKRRARSQDLDLANESVVETEMEVSLTSSGSTKI